jgi:hypothetical protein
VNADESVLRLAETLIGNKHTADVKQSKMPVFEAERSPLAAGGGHLGKSEEM